MKRGNIQQPTLNIEHPMTGKRICAITGSNGYVGGCIKNYFAAHGWEILELTRRPKSGSTGAAFQLGAEISPSTLTDVNVLIHCAYDFRPLQWEEIHAVNVGGSRKLFQAARAAGVEKIINISSISAYDGCRSLYGRAKLEVEKIAQDAGALTIRPGLVYGSGPGLRRAGVSADEVQSLNASVICEAANRPASTTQAGGMFGKLTEQVQQSSLIPMIGDGSQIQFLVYDEDLSAFIERYADGEIKIASGILTAANEQPWAFKKLLLEIARALDKKLKFIPLPWRLVWAGLKSAELCGLRLNFRSDSLVSLMYQNPRPDFSPNAALGLTCRPFEIQKLKL
jgi:nucleoside-diphosphate-sugar epimerase